MKYEGRRYRKGQRLHGTVPDGRLQDTLVQSGFITHVDEEQPLGVLPQLDADSSTNDAALVAAGEN